jgi:thiamine biosynthesis lipoprotein
MMTVSKKLVVTAILVAGWLPGVAISAGQASGGAWSRFHFAQTEMAVPMELTLYAADSAAATAAAQAAFARIHQLNAIMSDYDPNSELCRLGDASGGGVAITVSDDLWKVLGQAQAISRRSGGAFDVTIGPVVRLWRRARRRKELPGPSQIKAALGLVDYRLMRLDPQRHAVELLRKGMRLDLGGIAKGYAMGEALAVLRARGIPAAMIHGGGDMALGDPPPGKPGWRVGIAPLDVNAPASFYLWLSRCAVSTSGDAWQFVEIGGKRYSHIVDPHTGIGLVDHSMVTLVGNDSTLTDGLTKAVLVEGPEKGLQLIEATPGMAAYILRSPQGKTETYQSSRWKQLPLAAAGDH